MQRFFASLIFCGAALFASAQNHDITVIDTDAMRASADKHTALVDQTVTLDADQKTKVQEIYMNLERKLDAMNQRFEKGGLTKEQREAEMAPQWTSLEKAVDQQLAEVLTADQATKWREAKK
jgi:Skp family chaperone for outer membrane proteins